METYEEYKEYFLSKKHHALRRTIDVDLASEYAKQNLSPIQRMAKRFEYLTKEEKPIVWKREKIAFLRTISNIPDLFTEEEWKEIKASRHIHERGYHSNISPDYGKVILKGLQYFANYSSIYSSREVNCLINLVDRYAEEARKVGNIELYNVLTNVSRKGASTFHEALQLFRIVHFGLWLEGNYHITVGRFDQYMYPYYKRDIENGVLTKDEAYALLEEFFLSFNKDNDLYPGIQQGDNGQAMVLGGMDENGVEQWNELSELCLKASGALLCIDPKINIRVNKNTPIEIYEKGTELTKVGLGFPQYTNDDIAIPTLINTYGYDKKDAYNYVVAACWELIVPAIGTDIPNIGALSFVKMIDRAIHNSLEKCKSMDDVLAAVRKEIKDECDSIASAVSTVWFIPSPLLNITMDLDVEDHGKYNNFGIHGSGVTNAADSLAAIQKYVFEEKSISAKDYLKAVDEDFANAPDLLHKLRYETPKVGQNDDYADKYLVQLLDMFADALEGKRNTMGGCFRAGTGSAMYYLWHADEIGASPDGRRAKEPLGTNFSVSLFAQIGGPFSLIQSLSKPHFNRAFNGGPVTLEFDSNMWKAADAVPNFAKFVKTFFALGGHQLQLNSISLETLKDAQLHPEKYDRLVVRIWGWSAYFTALDKPFQDHVIRRQAYKM